tara:strand:- start:465 stop:632 length:168 start_codon:yes stop_codon:yes gene_type:complete
MLENISQEKFEHIINLLIVYKQFNPNKDVYLSEKSIKDAMTFMTTTGKNMLINLD